MACETHSKESVVHNALEWFDPIFKIIELFNPIISTVVGAHPGGNLALGGIMGILQSTNKLEQYQTCTLQMLAKMGRKASIISEYQSSLYDSDDELQALLVQVVGDIIVFCDRGIRILDTTRGVRAKIRGLKLSFFRDFQTRLGEQVDAFDDHMDRLDSRAAICDKRRLRQILDDLESQRSDQNDTRKENRTLMQQQEDRLKDSIEKASQKVIDCESWSPSITHHLICARRRSREETESDRAFSRVVVSIELCRSVRTTMRHASGGHWRLVPHIKPIYPLEGSEVI